MMVRLAFSLMIQSDAEILLIDEVLAVGDAAFQKKCNDVFAEIRESGRTVVLVTHDMNAIQKFCHRALFLEEGEVKFIGDPEEAARQYLVSNFEGSKLTAKEAKQFASLFPQSETDDEAEIELTPDLLIRSHEAWLEGSGGERKSKLQAGEKIRVRAVVEARRELVNPRFRLHITQPDGHPLFDVRLSSSEHEQAVVPAGRRIELVASAENPLLDGRYVVTCWVTAPRSEREVAQQAQRLTEFAVEGAQVGEGIFTVPGELEVDLSDDGGNGAGRDR
jgi:ABC-2 type transport system ATP-binding protein